jgi:hypothetical protein
MKITTYLAAFVTLLVLSAAHFAFAEPVKAHRPVAMQESVKPRNQSHHTGVAPRRSYVVHQRTGKTGRIGMETRKSTPRIDGTGMHRRR